MLVMLIMQHGTICLWRLAAYAATSAQTSSVQRRFYRFFQYIKLDGAMSARVIVVLLGLSERAWTLAIDRTNWRFGKVEINILMVSVRWNGVAIPLIWTLLDTAGNSKTQTRAELLDRLSKSFPDMKVASFTGDREFIGNQWMTDLMAAKIPFTLRLRENQQVVREGYATMSIQSIAAQLRRGNTMIIKGRCQLGEHAGPDAPFVRLVIMRLNTGELLALATSGNPRKALENYRERWSIETMFANLKTRGFNMEDTHITNPDKLSTLLAILALAVAMAAKTGVAAARLNPISIKKHGRRALSIFALGLSRLRKIFVSANPAEIFDFIRELLSPKLPVKSLKSMPF